MNNISFKAETIKGEIIEACCVINKHDRLLLSNEAKAGFWIECKPDTLQVINKNQVEYCSYCGKSGICKHYRQTREPADNFIIINI
jgi:hypothetical protein